MYHIRILSANRVSRAGLIAEHGISAWIEKEDFRLLWDTGQGLVLKHNADRMGIDLEAIDAVALSHGHFDHSGGLRLVHAPVYCHPAALHARFTLRPSGEKRSIGIPKAPEKQIPVTKPKEITAGIWLTGPIPRTCSFEPQPEKRFFLDHICTQPDVILDDQAIFFDTSDGIVVVLGCAHAGVINTLNYITELRARPIRAILGGTHLTGATTDRINRTIEALCAFDISLIAVGHCTGIAAENAIRNAFPGNTVPFEVGADFTF